MRKNDKKQSKRQPVGGARTGVSQLKLALGTFIRETLYETVLISGLERRSDRPTGAVMWRARWCWVAGG